MSSSAVHPHHPPLPADPDAPPTFQDWHVFDPSSNGWKTLRHEAPEHGTSESAPEHPPLTLVTWNVDAFAKFPDERMAAIISTLHNLTPTPNILFFQEVSRATLKHLLDDPWVREHWYACEGNLHSWGGHVFSTITLLSKSAFSADKCHDKISIGPVWRVKYPSKFDRDALCCDVFLPSSDTRVRLINVHLDSLPLQPSRRPRQLTIISDGLRHAGRGLVAGDFNPVLPEDDSLVAGNGLIDVWDDLHPDESGFTWGLDGRELFPPGRLDKVAVLGLKGKKSKSCTRARSKFRGEDSYSRLWTRHCLGATTRV
ncbi:hypothetical protein BO71DRAFT_212849 [Aspergillus ellipticus CBS 707.79]|uniref:Endonuclease/exonuclease/phosphatase domain-containing protein n=1 Tax=Aspergillus ellipticus CBS 707.79 TaxID=1448320 RepID=A0A319DCD6_9EURO|nr:hypothetical protein BO71DRAFT_212849 [Aspergillus ellipticus CBS 707.79]